MSGADQAAEALRLGDYHRAHDLLAEIGAGKRSAGPSLRLTWALTQLLRHNMDECVELLPEVCGRSRSGESIYHHVRRLLGPLEDVFPEDAAQEIRLRLGDYYLRQQQPTEAQGWLEAARAGAPEDPLAVFLEANCRFELYGERGAVREMEAVLFQAAADNDRAYFMAGRTASLWFRLGVVHDRMQDRERAAQFLATAVELSDSPALAAGHATARLLLGEVLMRLGRFEEAIAELAAIPRDAHNYRHAVRLRAVALFRIGDSDSALTLLHELAELDPLGAATFLEMGRIYLAAGQIELAETALARAFRTDPEIGGLRTAIVTLERQLGRHMDPDAGLPSATEFTIPEEFAPRLDDPALARRPDFKTAWSNFRRVLNALIVRDILALHSHSGMGYFWALAQPVAFISAIAMVYSMAGHKAPYGTSVWAYLAAGIVPYFSFYIRVETSVASAVRSNVNLLYFRQVTPLVLIVAAFLREYLTGLVIFVLVGGAIAFWDKSVEIKDPLVILAAVTCISLLATVIGVFFGLGELAIPSLKLAETVVMRVMFFFSGALFYANLLPPRMREYAMYNPLLHLIEFVRDGYLTVYQSRYANWHYPIEFIFVGLAFMVVVLFSTRRYVVAQ